MAAKPKPKNVKRTAQRAATKAARRKPAKKPGGVLPCPQFTKEWGVKKNKTNDRWRKEKTRPAKKSYKDKWKGVSVGASREWASKEGQLRKVNNSDNLKLGKYGWSVKSGYSYNTKEKGHELNLIKAQAEFAAAAAEYKKEGKYLEGAAGARAFAASAEVSAGGEWSKKAKELHAKAGGSFDIVQGSVSGGFKIPLFRGHSLTLGGAAEGQVGASAEADAHAGWTAKKGYSAGFKLKAGFGLGAGLSFNIGFR